MKLLYTSGENSDFISLCYMLDDYLNQTVGGEKQRRQYNQYNTLEDIHDVVLVYDGEIPVASGGFKRFDDNTAEIKRVFVREEYRRKGIAKLLLNKLEEKAKLQGYSSLVLETGDILSAAMGLYRKLGFRMIDNYGPYKDMKESVCMRKDI